jgi:hypothetical protein
MSCATRWSMGAFDVTHGQPAAEPADPAELTEPAEAVPLTIAGDVQAGTAISAATATAPGAASRHRYRSFLASLPRFISFPSWRIRSPLTQTRALPDITALTDP